MDMMSEFREFAVKGNAMDLAVGIIIGSAFGKIVVSVVHDAIMPPIDLLMGGVNFSELVMTLKAAVDDAQAVTLNDGMFIRTVIDSLIAAWAVFLMIKGMDSRRRKQATFADKS